MNFTQKELTHRQIVGSGFLNLAVSSAFAAA